MTRMSTSDALANPAIRAAIEKANARALPLFDERGVFSFEVIGDPVPEGSMRPVWSKHLNRCIALPDDPKLKGWRDRVAAAAAIAMRGRAPVGKGKPLLCGAVFRIARQRHDGSNRNGYREDWPVSGYDHDKLLRAIHDAMTGVVYHDDAQIVGRLWPDLKRWTEPGERPGCTIRLTPLGAAQKELGL